MYNNQNNMSLLAFLSCLRIIIYKTYNLYIQYLKTSLIVGKVFSYFKIKTQILRDGTVW